jgi:hypothetical protein
VNYALPVLLYGSETWTIKARDAGRITAAEMKYMGRTSDNVTHKYRRIKRKTEQHHYQKYKSTPVSTAPYHKHRLVKSKKLRKSMQVVSKTFHFT